MRLINAAVKMLSSALELSSCASHLGRVRVRVRGRGRGRGRGKGRGRGRAAPRTLAAPRARRPPSPLRHALQRRWAPAAADHLWPAATAGRAALRVHPAGDYE